MKPEPLSFEPPVASGGADLEPLDIDGQSAKIFRLLVSSVRDYAIFVLDAGGCVKTWNEGAQRIKGYSAEEIIGKHFSIFYNTEAVEAGHPDNELEIAQAAGSYEEEGWRLRKDGSQMWANVVITALHDETGKLIGFAKVTRDLTERRAAERQREELTHTLLAANEEMQHLAYVISHELQPPVSTIDRYCNLLSVRYKDRLGKDADEFMSKLKDASHLIGRMVDDLWTYARVNRPSFEQETIDLNLTLKDVVSGLKDILDESEVSIGELPTILGQRRQLGDLFKELLRNAVKFRSILPPHIQIRSQAKEGGWLITIKDNGIGIDKIHLREIFKLYHRLGGGPDPTSTGMGLALCQKIMARHRGKIWCESEFGQGAIFHLWFPSAPNR